MATHLFGKKSYIFFDTLQESAEVGWVAHIGRVARGERRAVVGETEDAMALAQQGASEAALLFKRNPFGRQRDAFDEAEPGGPNGSGTQLRAVSPGRPR